MTKEYAPLRPNDAGRPSGQGPVPSRPVLPKRRRVGVSVACNSCRRKKIRCDGQRPACSACADKTVSCSYRDDIQLTQESQKLLREVIRLLNTLPQSEVLPVLGSLRDEHNAAMILSTFKDGFATRMKPSDQSAAVAIMDSSFHSIELEAQNPNAYHFLPPLHPEVLEGVVYRQLTTSRATNEESNSALSTRPSRLSERETPMGSVVICDDRLRQLNIGYWTPVPISNEVAARAISMYLETDHPLLGYFDPDLFVSDLTSAKADYCSSLLVNALLYWACMYIAVDASVDRLALQFCTEAERLWRTEKDVDSIHNLAAAQLLSMGYLGQGRNHAVLSYLGQASDMAVRMGLFGVEGDGARARIDKMTSQGASAYLHAAWGSFNWITLMSVFYRQPGLQCPRYPPRLPIPGEAVGGDAMGGVDGGQLPPQSRYMGGLFPYLCRFWEIMHEVSLAYGNMDEEEDAPSGLMSGTLGFAEYKFRELLAWSNSLPSHLSRDDQHPHYVQVLHIWFHTAVLDIFRPFINSSSGQRRLRTFTSGISSPDVVYAASVCQLKQLIVNYRLNFVASTYAILWHSALIYLSNAILRPPKEDDWFFYFLVCVYGYERLRPSWRVTQAIATALLSLALRSGGLSGYTARRILRDLQRNDLSCALGRVRATFMVDLNLARSDPSSATVEKQAGDFEHNALLEEYTNEFDAGRK